MNVTYEAGLTVLGQSIGMLRAAVDDVPEEALDWTPAADMSSLAVLTMHATSSARFFCQCSAGRIGSRDEYRATIRVAAFETKAVGHATLHAAFDALLAELPGLFAGAGEAHLAAVMPWKDEFDQYKTGAECLFLAVGHTREHVGHAQMLHDLWLAPHSPSR